MLLAFLAYCTAVEPPLNDFNESATLYCGSYGRCNWGTNTMACWQMNSPLGFPSVPGALS